MMQEAQAGDEKAIRALIAAQFASLNWSDGQDGKWTQFKAGFLGSAQLYPASRPAQAQTAPEFVSRLQRLMSDGTLRTFNERGVGCAVFIVGNVAIALAGCEMTENGTQVTKDVSAFLLVKNPDGWLIAAQAWDIVDDIPAVFNAAGLQLQAAI